MYPVPAFRQGYPCDLMIKSSVKPHRAFFILFFRLWSGSTAFSFASGGPSSFLSPTAYFLPTAGKVDRRGQIIFYEKVVCVSFVFPYRLFIDFGNGSFYDSGIIIAATSAVAEGACFIIPLCLLGIDRKNIVRPLDRYHSQHLLISV